MNEFYDDPYAHEGMSEVGYASDLGKHDPYWGADGAVTTSIDEEILPDGSDGAVAADGLGDFTDEFAALHKQILADAGKGRIDLARRGLSAADSLYRAKYQAAGAALWSHYQALMQSAQAQIMAAEARVRAGALVPDLPSGVKQSVKAEVQPFVTADSGWGAKKMLLVGLGVAGLGALGWYLWTLYRDGESEGGSEEIVEIEEEEAAA